MKLQDTIKKNLKVGDMVKCVSQPLSPTKFKIGKEYEVKTIGNKGLYVKTGIENYIYGWFKSWEKINKEWDNVEN